MNKKYMFLLCALALPMTGSLLAMGQPPGGGRFLVVDARSGRVVHDSGLVNVEEDFCVACCRQISEGGPSVLLPCGHGRVHVRKQHCPSKVERVVLRGRLVDSSHSTADEYFSVACPKCGSFFSIGEG